MTTLVRAGRGDTDGADPGSRVAELERRLTERVAELARMRTELAAFTVDYRQRVGRLHEELDELEDAIGEAELGELRKRLGEREASAGTASARERVEPSVQLTSDAVRRLFRDVAKAIHPDLAGDEPTRDRRHALMVEANRAYAVGDEERLRTILESWERSPEAVQGSHPAATRLRLVRRAAQIEEELAAFESDLAAMKDSPMWQLKTMVDEAAGRGKDLVGDMVRRLTRDIVIARNRLAAIAWTPPAADSGV